MVQVKEKEREREERKKRKRKTWLIEATTFCLQHQKGSARTSVGPKLRFPHKRGKRMQMRPAIIYKTISSIVEVCNVFQPGGTIFLGFYMRNGNGQNI